MERFWWFIVILSDDEFNHQTDEVPPRLSTFLGASNESTEVFSLETGTEKSFRNWRELDDSNIDSFNSNVFYSDHL